MNKRDRELLKEFDEKIDALNKNVINVGEESNKINNSILELKKRIPKWYKSLITSLLVSATVSLSVSLVVGPAYFHYLESNQMNNVNFLLTTDGNVYISNVKIDAYYNFSIVNFNTDVITNDVTLQMAFNFENENISVIVEHESSIPYKINETTKNTLKYVWDYIPKKEGNSPGRIFLVFRVIRYPKTNGTLTINNTSRIAPTITVSIENVGIRNVITPPGFLWEKYV